MHQQPTGPRCQMRTCVSNLRLKFPLSHICVSPQLRLVAAEAGWGTEPTPDLQTTGTSLTWAARGRRKEGWGGCKMPITFSSSILALDNKINKLLAPAPVCCENSASPFPHFPSQAVQLHARAPSHGVDHLQTKPSGGRAPKSLAPAGSGHAISQPGREGRNQRKM